MTNWVMAVLANLSAYLFELYDDSDNKNAGLQTLYAIYTTALTSRIMYALSTSTYFLSTIYEIVEIPLSIVYLPIKLFDIVVDHIGSMFIIM